MVLEVLEGHEKSSTFTQSLSLPIHRWFRYSAGFSAKWAESEIRASVGRGETRVLDPFAGAGTVLLEAERAGVPSYGLEAHPFVARIARAKLAWRQPVNEFLDAAGEMLDLADGTTGEIDQYPPLIAKCYPPETLAELDTLRTAWRLGSAPMPFSELTWLALTSILRLCSPVGTAQWQYVLPNKTKGVKMRPREAFRRQVEAMAGDMRFRQMETHNAPAAIALGGDARACNEVPPEWATLVLTSPPYVNNYDYADAMRLEMSFWGEIEGWGDLQNHVRRLLIRSCTQHVDAERAQLDELLADPHLDPIADEVRVVCEALAHERLQHGGKKSYHLMVPAYFGDLAAVWQALRRVTASRGKVCFVIGDSAPYGVHVPVERWLGDLALAAGFTSYAFRKTRDRNIKWKNRKHTVPLHEGQLWIEA